MNVGKEWCSIVSVFTAHGQFFHCKLECDFPPNEDVLDITVEKKIGITAHWTFVVRIPFTKLHSATIIVTFVIGTRSVTHNKACHAHYRHSPEALPVKLNTRDHGETLKHRSADTVTAT